MGSLTPHSLCCCPVATQPRIEHDVEEIDKQVRYNEHEANEEQVGRHHRNVDELHSLYEHGAKPGPLEHALGNDGKGNNCAELEPDDCDDRDHRICQSMLEVDAPLRQTPRATELDVV